MTGRIWMSRGIFLCGAPVNPRLTPAGCVRLFPVGMARWLSLKRLRYRHTNTWVNFELLSQNGLLRLFRILGWYEFGKFNLSFRSFAADIGVFEVLDGAAGF